MTVYGDQPLGGKLTAQFNSTSPPIFPVRFVAALRWCDTGVKSRGKERTGEGEAGGEGSSGGNRGGDGRVVVGDGKE